MNAQEFVEANQLKCETQQVRANPFMFDDKWNAYHYLVTILTPEDKAIPLFYSVGVGHVERLKEFKRQDVGKKRNSLLWVETRDRAAKFYKPDLADFLAGIAYDCRVVEEMDLEEFMEELGGDVATYDALKMIRRQLKHGLGPARYQQLLEVEEQ